MTKTGWPVVALWVSAALFLSSSQHVNGACVLPTAQSGAIEYFSSTFNYKVCNVSTWEVIDLGSSLGPCSRDRSREYDTTFRAPKVCNNNGYQPIRCNSESITGHNFCPNSTEIKLMAPDGEQADYLGLNGLAISGDTAIVGAYMDDIGPNADQGSAYVFTRTGGIWSLQAKLTASDGGANDYFGYAIAIEGDTALISAYGDDETFQVQGSVYVFTRSGTIWSQQAKLTASDPSAFAFFGLALAFQGDTVFIQDLFNSNQGAVYVFTRLGAIWSQQAKLTASDGVAGDRFGSALALYGDTAIFGAYATDVGGNVDQGAAYVFTRNGTTWSEQVKLLASNGALNDGFGISVALYGNTAIIGAGSKDVGGNNDQGVAYVFTVSGNVWSEQAILTASDGAAGDYFGGFIALYENTALISSLYKTVGGNINQGAAYVFTGSGASWREQRRLTASDGAANDYFGQLVALNKDVALVGAYGVDKGGILDPGALYIYSLLLQEANTTSSDGVADDMFGYSVSLYGDTAIIGARQDVVGSNTYQGSAYVYIRSGGSWSEQAKLTASDGAASDFFGTSVSIYGDTVVIGSQESDVGGNLNQGSAYIFTRSGSTWSEQVKLLASDGAAGDLFGYSVSIYGETAVIGAKQTDPGGPFKGAAYIYTRSGSTWSEQAKLLASDGAAGDSFGFSVSIYADTALIGAPLKSVNQGASYVFTRSGSTWSEQAKLTASDGLSNDQFGYSVALYADTAIIGAPYDDVGPNIDQGSAYAFARTGGVWIQESKFTPTTGLDKGIFGTSVAIFGDIAVIGAPDLYSSLGSAYLFGGFRGSWKELLQFTPSDGLAGDAFGYSAAIYGETIMTGAPLDDLGLNVNQGSAHIFKWTIQKNCQNSIVNKLGAAQTKVNTASWTALSNIALYAGDTLLVCVGTALDSVSGITWNGIPLARDATANGTAKVSIFSLPIVSGATGDITVTLTGGTTTGKALTANFVSGFLSTSFLDQQKAGTGASTTPSSGVTAATLQPLEFLFGCIATNGPNGDAPGSWGGNFISGQRLGSTGAGPTSNMTASDGYLEVNSIGSYTASKSGITSRNWAAAIATYKIITPPTVQSCYSYGSCLAAGSIDYSPGNGVRWCDGYQWRQFKTNP